jgi:hypothetical protein
MGVGVRVGVGVAGSAAMAKLADLVHSCSEQLSVEPEHTRHLCVQVN